MSTKAKYKKIQIMIDSKQETAPSEAGVANKAEQVKVENTAELTEDESKPVVSDKEKEFDWEELEDNLEDISPKKRKEMEDLYVNSFGFLKEREIVIGTVTELTDREVIVDINSKSEGIISLNEFRYNPDIALGDQVDVLVDKMEDKTGQLVLSHRKARLIKAWEKINQVHQSGEIVTGNIKSRTKGGMIVEVFGIEAFLPGSQIDVKPIRDYDQYVNKNMEFKVVKINHEFKNVVVSHKVLIEADIEIQKKEIISKLEKGQVLEGIVKNITSYGVFMDLGGVDGLIHITDLSWSRVNHPSEIVELDEKIKVVILDFDESKTKIQLGIKQLHPHPWESLDSKLVAGNKVKGKVSVLADYGAFIEIVPGVEGLIHVSEMSWSTHLRSAQDFVEVGQEIETLILTLDREERKISLSIKQLTPDPWAEIATKYAVGSKHKGFVRNFTNFGVFVELEEGIEGLIHITDLSWTKKVKHPSEFFAAGKEIEVVVLEFDTQGRKLSLGHKQLKENPWNAYEKKYTIGTIVNAKIEDSFDKGATVLFDEGEEKIEAFIPARHTEKEDGTRLKQGEESEFKVIELSKEFKRIVLSHKAVYQDKEKKAGQKAHNTLSKSQEKSRLGDLDVLSQLKEKISNNKDE